MVSFVFYTYQLTHLTFLCSKLSDANTDELCGPPEKSRLAVGGRKEGGSCVATCSSDWRQSAVEQWLVIIPLTLKETLGWHFDHVLSDFSACFNQTVINHHRVSGALLLSPILGVVLLLSSLGSCLSALTPLCSSLPGVTGGLAAPLVAAGAGAVLGAGGAAALGSATGIAIMASLFGAAGAGLTGKKKNWIKKKNGWMTQIWLDFKCFCGETACWLCWLSTLQDIRWKSVSAPLRNLSFCLWAPESICTWPSLWLVGSVAANTVSACHTYHNINLHWVVAVC